MRLRRPLLPAAALYAAVLASACANLALANGTNNSNNSNNQQPATRNPQAINNNNNNNNNNSNSNSNSNSNNKKPDLCKNVWRFPHNCVHNCIYMLIWRHVPEKDSIEFVVTTKYARRWTGVGFSPNKNLTQADAVFAWIENDTRFVMMDANLQSYSRPESDKQQSIFNLNAKGSYDEIFVFKFSRLRNTGDDEDFLLSDTNCPYVIFPVEGGSVKNRTVITTEYQPLVSDNPVCFTSCDASRKFNFSNIKTSRVPREVIQPLTLSPLPTTTTTSTSTTTTTTTSTTTTSTTTSTTTTPSPTPETSSTTTSTTTTTTTAAPTTTTSTTTQPPTTTSTSSPAPVAASTTTKTPLSSSSSPTSGERLVDAASEPAASTDQQQWCTGRWLFPAGCRFQQPETVSYLQLPVDRTRVIQPIPLELSDCTYAAQWQYEESTDLIKFIIQTKTRSRWTGVGFSNSTRMLNSDAIIGIIDELSGRHFIMDTWLKDHVMPDIDVEQNALDTYGKRENGTTTIRFSRPRRTKDQFDFQFSDDTCAYFFFPTQGGSFNAISKRLYKHEQTPSVSRQKICIRACTIGDASDQASPTSEGSELVSSSSSTTTSAAVLPVTQCPPSPSPTRPSPQATSTAASSHDLIGELDSASTSSAEDSGGNTSSNSLGGPPTPFMRLSFLSEPSIRWLAGIGCVATLLAMIVFQACFTVYKNKQAYKQALFRQSAFKQNAAYLHATHAASSVTTTSYPSTQTAGLRGDEEEPKKRVMTESIVVGGEDEEGELGEEEVDEMELEDEEGYVGRDGFGDEEEYDEEDEDDELAMERSLNYARCWARYAHPANQQPHHHHHHMHPHQQYSNHHPHQRSHHSHQRSYHPHQRSHHPHQRSHHPHQHYYTPHPLQAYTEHARMHPKYMDPNQRVDR